MGDKILLFAIPNFNFLLMWQYNGCLWKGGRLRLEKAKEDYLVRLKREWEQGTLDDATQKPPTAASEEEMPNTTQSSKSNTKHLNIFFPRLRKVTYLGVCLSCLHFIEYAF